MSILLKGLEMPEGDKALVVVINSNGTVDRPNWQWDCTLIKGAEAIPVSDNEDTISRRAAIKAIDDLPNCPNGYSDTYDKACIIGVLEEVPNDGCRYWDDESGFCALHKPADSVKHGKWIPCKEKLPVPNEHINHVWKYYLVLNEYADMMVASYRENTKGERYWEQMYHNYPVEDKIVAWMELPEEYKEGNEE